MAMLRPFMKQGIKLDFNQFLELMQDVINSNAEQPLLNAYFQSKDKKVHLKQIQES